jgi:hypothetical protein
MKQQEGQAAEPIDAIYIRAVCRGGRNIRLRVDPMGKVTDYIIHRHFL